MSIAFFNRILFLLLFLLVYFLTNYCTSATNVK